jgi:hypothetical protein
MNIELAHKCSNLLVQSVEDFLETYTSSDTNFDLKTMTEIDESILDEELSKNPGRYAWVSAVSAKLERVTAESKKNYEKTKSRCFMQYKSKQKPAPPEYKLTDEGVNNLIGYDEEVLKAYTEYLSNKETADIIAGILEALKQKSALLQTFCSNKRKEKDSIISGTLIK